MIRSSSYPPIRSSMITSLAVHCTILFTVTTKVVSSSFDSFVNSTTWEDQRRGEQEQQQRHVQGGVFRTKLAAASFKSNVLDFLQDIALNSINSFDPTIFGKDFAFDLVPKTDLVDYSANISAPALVPLNNDDITFELTRNKENPDRSVVQAVRITNIEVVIPSIVLRLHSDLPFQDQRFTCNLSWKNVLFKLVPPSMISLSVVVTGTLDGFVEVSLGESDYDLDTLILPLISNFNITGTRSCKNLVRTFQPTIKNLEKLTQQALLNQLDLSLLNQLTGVINDYVIDIGNQDFPLGAGFIRPRLGIDSLGLSSKGTFIQLVMSSSPTAILSNLTTRGNYSYTPAFDFQSVINSNVQPPFQDPKTNTSVVTTKTFGANIAEAGLNGLLASAFYLIWADLVGEIESPIDPRVCVPLNEFEDPCPFPPYEIITLAKNGTKSFLHRLGYWKLRRIFRRGGFYKAFRVSVILQPPEVRFATTGQIGGNIMATAYIQAIKRFTGNGQYKSLVKFDFPLQFEATTPSISVAGKIRNVKVQKIKIGSKLDGLKFKYYQPFPFQPTIRGKLVFRYLIVSLISNNLFRFYDTINNSFAAALNNIAVPMTLGALDLGPITLEPIISGIEIRTNATNRNLGIFGNFAV